MEVGTPEPPHSSRAPGRETEIRDERTSAPLDVATVRAAFTGPIAPIRVPALYRMGLALVALVMLLLPLIYVAFIAALVWLISWHALENTWILTAGRSLLYVVIYAGPIVAGGVLALFLLKPLLVRPHGGSGKRVIEPDEEPAFFALVEKIADTIRAPRPRRIVVDFDINAGASLGSGLGSVFRSNLVLTLGLPLVAALDAQQLAGVIAHELGHFAQGAGMRLTFVIRRIDLWFARVVYERDAWDQRLESWSRAGAYIGLVAWLSRRFIAFGRKLLKLLMFAGHAVSCLLSREMELDADRYETRLAGYEAFRRTTLRLPVLSVAHARAQETLKVGFGEGRKLPNNFARLVLDEESSLPASLCDEIRSHTLARKTGTFDTHPSPSERIANAEREAKEGVLWLDAPATALFRDFDALSRALTRDLNIAFASDDLSRIDAADSGDLRRIRDIAEERDRVASRYFGGFLDIHDPPFPKLRRDGEHTETKPTGAGTLELDERAGESRRDLVVELREMRTRFAAGTVDAQEALTRCEELRAETIYLERLLALSRTWEGVPTRKKFALTSRGRIRLLRRDLEDARKAEVDASEDFAPFRETLSRRLSLGLELLATPTGEAALAAKAGCSEPPITDLLDAAAALERAWPAFLELKRRSDVAEVIAEEFQRSMMSRRFGTRGEIKRTVAAWRGALEALRSALASTRDPFAPAGDDAPLAARLVPELPAPRAYAAMYAVAHQAQEAIVAMLIYVFAELAFRAEVAEVELALIPREDDETK